jgi:NAD(P)H-hydrate epimerase
MEKESQAAATAFKFNDVKSLLPKRSSNSHKGDFGSTLVLGGDKNMGGAAIMAAEAALKSGSGLVSLISHQTHLKASLVRNPEIMAIGCDLPEEAALNLVNKNVFVCGPGLSLSTWSEQIVNMLIKHLERNDGSVIFDAGALRYIAKNNVSLRAIRGSIILTPHPGEAADLLGVSVKEIQQDRIKAAKDLAAQYNATIILKGAGTVIVDEKIYVCEEGGPELATGGTGDILAGIIGSFIAQGLSAQNASLLAVAAHGLAGSEFVKLHGEKGLAASELIPLIRKKINNK